jgi:hypothetical protein
VTDSLPTIMHRLGSLGHLAKRFAWSAVPFGPPRSDEQWALGVLEPDEVELWSRMSRPDRRHAIGVARRTASLLGDEVPQVMAAALLHDVGKLEASLGTAGRTVVTAAALMAGRRRLLQWGQRSRRRFLQRAALYLTHDRLGADLLEAAGSDPLVVAWAAQHHMPSGEWTIDRRTAQALKDADDD